MRVRLAKKTGFCFGVKRAVSMAEDALKFKKPIYSLGSIIHNEQVVSDLSKRGLKVIKDIGAVKKGLVVISSHGLSPKKSAAILRKGLKIIDTTCPFVLKAQRTAKRLSDRGYKVVIVGDARHPEIRALVDFANKNVAVVKDRHEAAHLKLKPGDKVGVISQTTQSTENFMEAVKAILGLGLKEVKVFDTICRDAEERQRFAKSLAKEVDLMLIVGGADSANTRRLFGVCKKVLRNSRLIRTAGDLNRRWFSGCSLVGITSGASTPDWVVNEVVNTINSKFKN